MNVLSRYAWAALVLLSGLPTLHSAAPASGAIVHLLPGPWGSLEYYSTPLECPSDYLDTLTIPSQQTEWRFRGRNPGDLLSTLVEIGFDRSNAETLLRNASILSDNRTLRVFPNSNDVLAMHHSLRTNLYRHLASIEGNNYCRHPIYINTENLSQWFEGSLVPRSAVQDIARLGFPTPAKKGYYFCDLPLVLRQANSAVEERQIIQGLLRSRTLIVRIRMSPDMPLNDIADYWKADYKNKAVLPILESALQADENLALDIAHLLPATPRQYLNRFPTLADGIKGRFPDWFWTCYNFFQFTPVDVYADSSERDALLLSEFTPVIPPLQFGDMLLFNSGSKAVHGCIYIADDIVFTKNGADLFSPWVLMTLNDVVAQHDRFGDVSISAYRRISTGELDSQ